MQRPSTGVLAVLRTAQVARVLAASTVGRIPLASSPVALLVFARERWSIGIAGLLVAAYTIGLAIGGPMLARIADRWRQPPVMASAVTVSTAAFLVLAAGQPPLGAAVVAALLAGAGAPPFESGLRVLWRGLLPEERVHTAYSLDIAVQELIFIAGPLVSIAAIGAGGPSAGLYATAVLQLIGTIWFVTTPAVRRWRGAAADRHWAGALRAARLRVLLVAVVLVGAGVGALPVAVTRYAEVAGARSWAGWLLAAQATGALVGGLLNTRLKLPERHLPWAAAALAAGYAPLGLAPAPPVMLVLAAVSGLALPPLLTATFVMVDGIAPSGTAAEAFAWVATAFTAGAALGAALDGAILDRVPGAAAGFVLAPVVIGASTLLFRLAAVSRGAAAAATPR
ncbi:MFS transporter [Micromonospora sp. CPCC 206061]|uniref:MFS transporter n=1 Tax=Micromonospora sp. CPCC 206061 TaxID=3122410 RepID=UPI002FEFF028